MVTKVHGQIKQGVWVEKGVKFLSITATSGTFLEDLFLNDGVDPETQNTGLEQVLRAVAMRGTILGVSVASATVVHVMVGFGSGYAATDDTIGLELEAAINAIATPNLSGAIVAVNEGFASAALGTAT